MKGYRQPSGNVGTVERNPARGQAGAHKGVVRAFRGTLW